MTPIVKTFKYGQHTITLETGVIGKQTDASVMASMDDTSVFVTVVGNKEEPEEERDFFPLTVNYQERAYAAGRFPGGYFKREGRPSEGETLIARLIDRPIRPLFPAGFTHDVQIVITVVSANPEIPTDIISMIGTSAALAISGIPFNGPIGAARVGYINDQYVLNPLNSELKESKLDLVVAGTQPAVLMVESEAQILPEDTMLGAVMFGHEQQQVVIEAINDFAAMVNKPKWDWTAPAEDTELKQKVADFADKYKAMPTLGFTHFQPAQLVTVGKRASLWLQDLVLDLENVEYAISTLKLLGCKGTTGTQASFMDLFEGDNDKCVELDKKICQKMGFESSYWVSGQTYSRKIDFTVLSALCAIAQSAHKFSNDIRLLQHLKEIEEPFEKNQIGSSAMAYKRNPMRSERIASLSRYVIADILNPAMTASEQWFERTLDDSANKRISVPEAFLAVDAILGIYTNVVSGLVVYPKMIEKHIMDELPFMMTENIMMEATKRGGNRQELHEEIRQLSMQAGAVVKQEGKPNDLLKRIADDPKFGLTMDDLMKVADPKLYIGRCPQQVEAFINEVIKPILDSHKDDLQVEEVELKV